MWVNTYSNQSTKLKALSTKKAPSPSKRTQAEYEDSSNDETGREQGRDPAH